MLKLKQSIIFIILILLPLGISDAKDFFAWLIGIMLGLVFQRSKFCFAASFRDYFLFGSTSLLKTLLYTLIFSVIGFVAIQTNSPMVNGFPPGIFKPVGIHTALGGIIFGLGMTLGGGCLTMALIRLGEGFYISLITLISALFGIFLAIITYPYWRITVSETKIYLPDYFGNLGALVLALAFLVLILLMIWWKDRSYGDLPEYAATSEVVVWSPIKTSFFLAALNILLFSIKQEPFQLSHEFTHGVSEFLSLINIPPKTLSFFKNVPIAFFNRPFLNWEKLMILGLILGSFMSAVIFNEFRPKLVRSRRQLYLAIIGGLLMGFGARIAMGCTVGAMLSGIASQSLHGWVFALFLPFGVIAGNYVLQRIID